MSLDKVKKKDKKKVKRGLKEIYKVDRDFIF